MSIWSSEIKELTVLTNTIKGRHGKLENELRRLLKTQDENMLLVYARRCLEVIITELSENLLNRPRGTEPLKRIIDKLNKEESIPHHIVISMGNLNSLSAFGAHPKEFELRQVKPVLLNLTTIIEWYIHFLESGDYKKPQQVSKFTRQTLKSKSKIKRAGVILLLVTIAAVVQVKYDAIQFLLSGKSDSINSLVILPFDNFTGDANMDLQVAGMHSSLIYDMGRINGLRITSKTSSNVYKGKNASIKEIGNDLNTDAVIETEVVCYGDTICMRLKLISTSSEEQIWTKQYKAEKSRIFDLFNQVSRNITDEVMVKLSESEENLLAELRKIDPEAVDEYFTGQSYLDKIDRESLPKAIEHFEKAISIDDDWAKPYGGLAMAYGYQLQMGFGTPETYLLAQKNLALALKMDPNSADAHYLKAVYAVWSEWDWEKGEKEFEKALELNPNDALCRIFYSHFLMILRRTEEAFYQAELALKRDPFRPFVLGLYAEVMRYAGDFKSAIRHSEKALSIEPGHYFAESVRFSTYALMGDFELFFEGWKKNKNKQISAVDSSIVMIKYREQGYKSAIQEIIKANERIEHNGGPISYIYMVIYSLHVGDIDKAMDYYFKVYEVHDPNMPYASLIVNHYPVLRNNEKYKELLRKMNLPLR